MAGTIAKNKLALIHIVKKELDLSDEEYRNILERVTGVRSAKDLTEDTFKTLMRYFVRSKHYKINAIGLTLKQRMYIKDLAVQLAWSERHLNNFISKYYKKSHIDALTRKEAIKVIEALKHMWERRHGI